MKMQNSRHSVRLLVQGGKIIRFSNVCMQCRYVTAESTASASDFKSALSLDQLYPSSKFDFSKEVESKIEKLSHDNLKFSGYIPMTQLEIQYNRSSGPGGQNVNKRETKVEIRFHLDSAYWIPSAIRDRLKDKERNRMNRHGHFIITSDKTRRQDVNLADCLDKLRWIIRHHEPVEPRPPTDEEITKTKLRAERAARLRLREKRDHSMTKQFRSNNADIS